MLKAYVLFFFFNTFFFFFNYNFHVVVFLSFLLFLFWCIATLGLGILIWDAISSFLSRYLNSAIAFHFFAWLPLLQRCDYTILLLARTIRKLLAFLSADEATQRHVFWRTGTAWSSFAFVRYFQTNCMVHLRGLKTKDLFYQPFFLFGRSICILICFSWWSTAGYFVFAWLLRDVFCVLHVSPPIFWMFFSCTTRSVTLGMAVERSGFLNM